MKNSLEELGFFDRYHRVVYHVLSRLNIRPHQSNYDDHKQMGLIELVRAREEFDEDPASPSFSYRFVAYAKNKIRWKVIDGLRKESRIQSQQVQWEDGLDRVFAFEIDREDQNLLDWLQVIRPLITDQEYAILLRLLAGQTVTTIAKQLGLSRQTIYRRRQSMAQKCAHLKSQLKGEN